jgi:hypothetical protein
MKLRSPLATLLVAGAALVGLMAVNTLGGAGGGMTAPPLPAAAASPAPAPAPASPPPASAAPASPAPAPASPVPPAFPPPVPAPPSLPPAPPAFSGAAVYAGDSTGGPASVVLAVSNGHAAGLVCEGHSVESWLTGTATAGRVELRSEQGDIVTAQLADGRLSGTAGVGDRSFTFTVSLVEVPGGLYRGWLSRCGRTVTIGWVVVPDAQVGSNGGSGNGNGPGSALRLDPDVGCALDDCVPVTPVTGRSTP